MKVHCILLLLALTSLAGAQVHQYPATGPLKLLNTQFENIDLSVAIGCDTPNCQNWTPLAPPMHVLCPGLLALSAPSPSASMASFQRSAEATATWFSIVNSRMQTTTSSGRVGKVRDRWRDLTQSITTALQPPGPGFTRSPIPSGASFIRLRLICFASTPMAAVSVGLTMIRGQRDLRAYPAPQAAPW